MIRFRAICIHPSFRLDEFQNAKFYQSVTDSNIPKGKKGACAIDTTLAMHT